MLITSNIYEPTTQKKVLLTFLRLGQVATAQVELHRLPLSGLGVHITFGPSGSNVTALSAKGSLTNLRLVEVRRAGSPQFVYLYLISEVSEIVCLGNFRPVSYKASNGFFMTIGASFVFCLTAKNLAF